MDSGEVINFPMQRGLLPHGSLTPNNLSFSIITIEYDNLLSSIKCLIRDGQSELSISILEGFKQSACVINSLSEWVESSTPLANT